MPTLYHHSSCGEKEERPPSAERKENGEDGLRGEMETRICVSFLPPIQDCTSQAFLTEDPHV